MILFYHIKTKSDKVDEVHAVRFPFFTKQEALDQCKECGAVLDAYVFESGAIRICTGVLTKDRIAEYLKSERV